MENRRILITKQLLCESFISLLKQKPNRQNFGNGLCQAANVNRGSFSCPLCRCLRPFGTNRRHCLRASLRCRKKLQLHKKRLPPDKQNNRDRGGRAFVLQRAVRQIRQQTVFGRMLRDKSPRHNKRVAAKISRFGRLDVKHNIHLYGSRAPWA